MTSETTDTDALAALRGRLDALDASGALASIEREQEAATAAALDRLETRVGAHVLTLGASGATLERLLEKLRPERVMAIDAGAARIEGARRRAGANAPIRWQNAFDGAGKLPADHFDVVLAGELMALLPSPEERLANFARATRVGGRFALVLDFYAENTAVHRRRREFDLPFRLFSVPGWTRRIENAGFTSVEASRIRSDSGSPWRAVRGSLLLLARR